MQELGISGAEKAGEWTFNSVSLARAVSQRSVLSVLSEQLDGKEDVHL